MANLIERHLVTLVDALTGNFAGFRGADGTIDTNIALTATDASGNTVLVGAGGNNYRVGHVGELFIKPLTYLVCATTVAGSQTHLHFDDVIVDDLGCYNATTHLIEIPTDIVKIDFEYASELASVASGFGSSTGTIRAMTMNNNNGGSLTGLSALPCSRVGMDGGAYARSAFSVYTPATLTGNDRIIKPRFIQDSGGDIRIGDSTGTGVSQTYIKMRLYRA